MIDAFSTVVEQAGWAWGRRGGGGGRAHDKTFQMCFGDEYDVNESLA